MSAHGPGGRLALLVIAVAVAGACGGDKAAAPARPTTTAGTVPVTAPPTTVVPVPTVPVPTGTAPFVSPIRPDNRPTPVAGATNGELPTRDLVGVGPNCMALRAAAPSLGLLFATARNEGVVLGAEECYRPLAGQVAAQRNATARGNSACAASVPTTPTGKPKGTSMHGWGKAGDFTDARGSLTFGSPGDRFMTARANRFGWNHPGWALPGGSACPEAWHWEWVGDGGIRHLSAIRADVVALLPTPDGQGYATVTGLGALVRRGNAPDHGAAPSSLAWLIIAAAPSSGGRGYWLAARDGSVLAFGDAGRFGSTATGSAPAPVVGMAATPGGGGYWLVSADGRVAGFGDAGSFGSPPQSLHRPAVAIVASPGRGYWIACADGRVFAFGDAVSFGDASGRALPASVVAMAATPDGRGYWLAGADGSVYAFGSAAALGSAVGTKLAQPVVSIAATPTGHGYWLAAADGRVLPYGDARYYGAG